jgi:hypothetical protein
VRPISREGQASESEPGTLRDCTPDLWESSKPQKKIQSVLHGDVQRPAEMTGPSISDASMMESNKAEP